MILSSLERPEMPFYILTILWMNILIRIVFWLAMTLTIRPLGYVNML
jgi:hypothetical protein